MEDYTFSITVIIFKDIGYALKPNLQEDGSKIPEPLNPV